jgi:flagellar basal-body rod modification protein FlgD
MASTTTPSFTSNLASITRTPSPSPTQKTMAAATTATPSSNGMDKTSFLKLFTTQLQNQNPLEPVKNEAFVAQLAQFSQLEATTNMSESLGKLVSSMQSDRMLGSASLVGKMVAAPDQPAVLSQGQPVMVGINLPNGADSIVVKILDGRGNTVRTGTLPGQKAGLASFSWDGADDSGKTLADGNYTITATATLAGKTAAVTAAPMTRVMSVSSASSGSDPVLDLASGRQINFSTVLRVGN